jgi:predicted glycosyltransferase
VALSHASHAQVIAARLAGVPAVTMMDYEYQPANHLTFRLATRVIVPEVFPAKAITRFGARGKVRRYAGFKEDLYVSSGGGHGDVLAELRVPAGNVVVVMRPPPDGALYHRNANLRFDEVFRFRGRLWCERDPRTA